ncbi:MAG: NADH-quinone oxidoreductase subunit C, partial [Candidatus Hodarchaeales archaeon]
IIKTRCSYSDPVIPSLAPVTQSANYHEREIFDLFGIRFPGHPRADDKGSLPHLLIPDDWPQYEDDPPFPFRKEYVQKPRPFEKVTDTRGHQGKQWQKFNRPIDRSGWLDEYYKETSPTEITHTKKVYRTDEEKDNTDKKNAN